MDTRGSRLIRNTLYSVFAWVLPVTLGFVVTPLLLNRLGVESYGVYLVVVGFLAYSFSFSVSRSVAKYVAELGPSGEIQKANSVITSAFLISLVIGLIGMVAILLVADRTVTEVLQVSEPFRRPAVFALMVGGISIPLILVGQVYQNILQGTHRFGSLSVITNLNWLLLNSGNVALVFLGYGIEELLVWTVLVSGLISGFSYLALRRLEPKYGLELKSVGLMARPVLSYSLSVISYQLLANALLVFERAWLMRKFGPEIAAYYLVPMMLTIYFHGFMVGLTSAVFPVFNEMLDDHERSLDLYRKISKVVLALATLFFLTFLFGSRSFIAVWIDPSFSESSYRLLIIHAGTFSLIPLFLATWQINEAYGAPRLNAFISAIWTVVGIGLMIVVGDRLAPEGVATARFAGVVVAVPLILYAEKRAFGVAQLGFWRWVLLRIGAASAVLTLIEYPVFQYFGTDWRAMLVAWLGGSLAFCLVLYSTGLISTEEKDIVLRALGLKDLAVK